MKKNAIDIFIPYWGDPDLLKIAVESVINQTSSNWTLTVIDDNYPDRSAENFCKKLRDPRFTYIRNNKNLGITRNFNKCVSLANSKYMMIMGCDDVLMPNYVDEALIHIKDVDFYQPNVNIIDAAGKIYLPIGDRIKKILQPKKSGVYSGQKLASSLCIGNWLYFPAITWKTETIKKYSFNEKYKIVQDVYLELNLIKDGGKLYFNREVSFNYRRFNESLSSREKNGVRFHEEKDVYSIMAKEFNNIGWKKTFIFSRIRITSRFNNVISSVYFK